MSPGINDLVLRGLDQRVETMRVARGAVPRPARGWLRAVRTAIGLSQQKVASRTGVTRASYAGVEAAEERGAVTVASLERAARAMDCDLVYFLVPREGVAPTFADLARQLDPAGRHLRATEHSMALEGQAAGDPPARPSGAP